MKLLKLISRTLIPLLAVSILVLSGCSGGGGGSSSNTSSVSGSAQ